MPIQGLSTANVRERSTLDAGGNPSTEVVITIVTDLGNSGTLVIPARLYNGLKPEELANLIIERINQLDAVHLL